MKFYFNILLLFFLLSGNSYSKILNINDDFKIEVPNNFNIKKIENIFDSNSDLEFLEEHGISLYIVGNENIIDFFDKLLNGYNLEEEDWVIELVSKVEKKSQSTTSQNSLISYTKKEIKKTMIKYNLTTWTIVLTFDKPFQYSELEAELSRALNEDGIFNNLYSLSNSELNNIQKIVNKELKKNSTFVADEYVTYKFKPLKISRDKLSDIFLLGKVNISAEIWDKLKFSYSGKYYLTLKNDKIFGMYQECIFECSNFDKKFRKILKPVINMDSNKKLNKINLETTSNKENIVDQLKKLNDLYKSGVLTKEEFEKAKKRILN